jgi:flagellar biosynthesis protein FliQ
MLESLAVNIMREAIFYTLAFSAPPLLIAMVIGVTIALIGAVTQIQEQTLTSVPKMFAVFLVIAALANWMLQATVAWTLRLFKLIELYF